MKLFSNFFIIYLFIKIYKKCSFKFMANLSKLNLIIILSFCKFIYFFNFINIHSL